MNAPRELDIWFAKKPLGSRIYNDETGVAKWSWRAVVWLPNL